MFEKIKEDKVYTYSFILIILAVIMIVSLFTPYISAIGDFADNLKEHSEEVIYREENITAKDMINISMVEVPQKVFVERKDDMMISTILVSLIGAFSLLVLLFGIFKKPIAVLIFNIFSLAVYIFQNISYGSFFGFPNDRYVWGFGYYLFYIVSAIIFIGAILLLIAKIRAKKSESNLHY